MYCANLCPLPEHCTESLLDIVGAASELSILGAVCINFSQPNWRESSIVIAIGWRNANMTFTALNVCAFKCRC